ncbi:drug/metabolite transporter (DMT)-like permease [Siphonobacter sp. BAB-5404]|nr:drug/metabolite transporter (DMT)-like permease [Siphonobacter sp. SORGH_AS_0500]
MLTVTLSDPVVIPGIIGQKWPNISYFIFIYSLLHLPKHLEKIKGSILVALGAASYGVLATFVKLAHGQGYSTAEITFSQFIIGFVTLGLLQLFQKKQPITQGGNSVNTRLQLMLAGTSLGLTSTFYYLTVQYLPVSVCIILLMQSIWMGLLLECVLMRTWPTLRQIISTLMVLIGTMLATNLIQTEVVFSGKGLMFGLLAAMSYTVSMYSSNKVAPQLAAITRSMYLVLGGLLAIIIFWNTSLIDSFRISVLWPWGGFLALFGTIIPPLLFTRGMPMTGIALGSILGSVEIPVSILCAHLILHEKVIGIQWLGVVLIITAVFALNVNFRRGKALTS